MEWKAQNDEASPDAVRACATGMRLGAGGHRRPRAGNYRPAQQHDGLRLLQDTPTDKFGLVRTASLIQQARQQVTNAVLVDNGESFRAAAWRLHGGQGVKPGDVPVYKAMNTLNYVVGNIGNHEFNYGLDYLKNAIAGAKFPYINATSSTPKRKTAVHAVHHRRYAGERPRRQGASLRIGYIGFVPPQILVWTRPTCRAR